MAKKGYFKQASSKYVLLLFKRSLNVNVPSHRVTFQPVVSWKYCKSNMNIWHDTPTARQGHAETFIGAGAQI